VKQAARAGRESELATEQLTLPAKRYGVIYADPPCRFEVYSRDTGLDRNGATGQTNRLNLGDCVPFAHDAAISQKTSLLGRNRDVRNA
jgi:hypothetical protein